ncbi:exported hypothetical protein [uncultured delta proteobacterium]|uniref:Tripartite tricarboxylate transporter substrate binding protein n=1 Tax=uncultured delta proteobacterium TaxID=34034 RepID=A0A212KAN2_9DELT|nr:exported hypothetical protein [uncultured delta proteobacterium]
MKKLSTIVVCALICALCAIPASAAKSTEDNWPKGNIQIVIPYSTGGSPDVIMRAYAEYSKLPILVSNMQGSSGMIATKHVRASKPDGYTFLAIAPETILTLYHGGDSGVPASDLEWVAGMAAGFSIFCVKASSPYNTWADLVKYAKANPGKVTVTASGSKSFAETIMHIMNESSEIDMTWVPQKSLVDARTSVIGGHNVAVLAATDECIPYIKSGDLKALWVASDTPYPQIENVPLLKDVTKDPTMVFGIHRGLQGPKGIPQAILDTINADIVEVMKSEEFKNKIKNIGYEPLYLNQADYTKVYIDLEPRVKAIWDKYK